MTPDLFPYSPRHDQERIISNIQQSAANGTQLVLESGTGTGKTICSLVGTLSAALEGGGRVLYLTRTNSQQKQVLLEARSISKQHRIRAVGIVGRAQSCLLARELPELLDGTPEELSKLCSRKKRKVQAAIETGKSAPQGGCHFYEATLQSDPEDIIGWFEGNSPTIEEFMAHCNERGLCPYELNKGLIKGANVVSAPYIYYFHPSIQQALMSWMNTSPEDLHIILDEAHNIPDYLRDLSSSKLTLRTIQLGMKESDKWGDVHLSETLRTSEFLGELEEALEGITREYVKDDDGLVPPGVLEEHLLSRFCLTSVTLGRMVEGMIIYGQSIRDRLIEKGKLPRSYLFNIASFLFFWMNLDEQTHIRLVRGGANPELEGYCMDPSIPASTLHQARSVLHMSGTLEPMDEYRDSLGLPLNTPLQKYPSPFPPENRLLLHAADVTTRQDSFASDPGIKDRLESYILGLLEAVPLNTGIFFPSFALMEKFMGLAQNSGRDLTQHSGGKVICPGGDLIQPSDGTLIHNPGRGLTHNSGRKFFIEERGMTQAKLMGLISDFKASKGGVLMSVMGGRVSEGIDFPGSSLEMVVIVGLPYPKPCAKQWALQRYYDIKFNKGWEYTVNAPTARRTLQTIGRLIRQESDSGVAIILDWRAKRFAQALGGLKEARDVLDETRAFYATGKHNFS